MMLYGNDPVVKLLTDHTTTQMHSSIICDVIHRSNFLNTDNDIIYMYM